MMKVKYKDSVAVWSDKTFRWTSKDKTFAEILNVRRPDDDDIPYGASFQIGGLDKIYLDAAKEVYGKQLKVLEFEPAPEPKETKGIVQ